MFAGGTGDSRRLIPFHPVFDSVRVRILAYLVSLVDVGDNLDRGDVGFSRYVDDIQWRHLPGSFVDEELRRGVIRVDTIDGQRRLADHTSPPLDNDRDRCLDPLFRIRR